MLVCRAAIHHAAATDGGATVSSFLRRLPGAADYLAVLEVTTWHATIIVRFASTIDMEDCRDLPTPNV
jgi:hypothetical protein